VKPLVVVRTVCRLHFELCMLLVIVVSTGASQQEGSRFEWNLSVWSLHVLPVYAWVLAWYSGEGCARKGIRRKKCAKSMMRDPLAVVTPDKGRGRKKKKRRRS